MQFNIFMLRLSSVWFKWFSVAPTYVGLRNQIVMWVDAKWVDKMFLSDFELQVDKFTIYTWSSHLVRCDNT